MIVSKKLRKLYKEYYDNPSDKTIFDFIVSAITEYVETVVGKKEEYCWQCTTGTTDPFDMAYKDRRFNVWFAEHFNHKWIYDAYRDQWYLEDMALSGLKHFAKDREPEELEPETDIPQLHGKPQSEIIRLKILMDVFTALSGTERKDVDERILITELCNTGKFTVDDALTFLTRACQNGQIYERRSGYYAKA